MIDEEVPVCSWRVMSPDEKFIGVHLDGTFRHAAVKLDLTTFGVPVRESMNILFTYAHANFNISPPDLPIFVPTVCAALDDFDPTKPDSDYPRLPEGLERLLWQLPNGWDLKQLREYWPAHELSQSSLPDHTRRANVKLPIVGPITRYMIHHNQHRAYTVNEVCALRHVWGANTFDEALTTVPKEVFSWCNEQSLDCTRGDWGENDWASRYSANSGRWEQGEVVNERLKIFDMTQYTPKDYV